MRKSFLSIFLNFCIILFVNAQSFPPVYEIKSDTIEWQDLDPAYWQMLEDNSGRLRIEDLTTPDIAKNFHYISEKRKVSDSLVNTYWFRYKLKNAMNREAKISLNSLSQYDDFYVSRSESNWKHFVSGYSYERDIKDGFKNADCIPLVLQPGEELIVYQRIFNKKKGLPTGFSIAIVSTEKLIQNYYIDDVDNGITRYTTRELQEMLLEGVLLLSFLINLVFFRITRKKEYLHFSLFVFFLGIDRLINVIATFLRWEHPAAYDYLGYINLSWIFILFFLIQFVRTFFKVNLSYPVWDKILFTLSILAGLFNIYATFSFDPCFFCGAPSVYFTIYSALISITCISAFITFLLNIRVKENFAKLVITGGSPLLLFWGLANIIFLYINLNLANQPAWMNSFFKSFRSIEVACTIWFVIFFTLILFIQFNQLRKQNAQQALENERIEKERETERREMIEQQKVVLEIEVAERTAELKQSLEELKSTQNQLIQSAKMASLGELTAGIAHEIQNPLNFVNNFSEVNKELIEEAGQEINNGNIDEVKIILKDLKENEQKINHHGKRADAIVKGMLEHSRTSTGVKELTDINKIADEYLRLSYHGMRAKDKSFNTELKTEFDENIGKINVVPQDIGRVLLNLYNNAFYALNEKAKLSANSYQPIAKVTTRKLDDKIKISVEDNGNGIPKKIVDKIFQPFFTTKPTGQGTGLGLSLAYDIVKAHGGEIKVKSKEDEGSEFVVQLPII